MDPPPILYYTMDMASPTEPRQIHPEGSQCYPRQLFLLQVSLISSST